VVVENDLYQMIMNGNAFFVIYGEGKYRDMVNEKRYPLKMFMFHYYSEANKIVRSHFAEAWMERHEGQDAAEQEKPNKEDSD